MRSRWVVAILITVGVGAVLARAQPAGQAGDDGKPRRVQNRAVPLARLPAEIYPRTAAASRPVRLATTTIAPKVADPLAAARGRLAKDAALREWFDQWQVDQAAERPTSPARVAELRALLEKTTLGAEDLGAVARAIADAEGANSDVAKAWQAAAAKGR